MRIIRPIVVPGEIAPTVPGVRFLYFDVYARFQRTAYGGRSSYGRQPVAHFDGNATRPAIWPELRSFLHDNALPASEFIRAQFLATRAREKAITAAEQSLIDFGA